jgi:hypothetical protein
VGLRTGSRYLHSTPFPEHIPHGICSSHLCFRRRQLSHAFIILELALFRFSRGSYLRSSRVLLFSQDGRRIPIIEGFLSVWRITSMLLIGRLMGYRSRRWEAGRMIATQCWGHRRRAFKIHVSRWIIRICARRRWWWERGWQEMRC